MFEPFAAFSELFHKRYVAEIPYFQGKSDRTDRDKRHSVEQMKQTEHH
jgi:hypothetical protein